MIPRDLFLPETRPAADSGGARGEASTKRDAAAGEFAWLTDRLDGEPERALDFGPGDESRPEANSVGASAGDSLAPNVIILPPLSVVVPFPDGQTVETGSSVEDGVEVTRLKMFPDEPNNIEVVDFRQSAEAKIIRLPLPAHGLQRDPGAPEASEETAMSQLPGGEAPPEGIAQRPATDSPVAGHPENLKSPTKAIAHAGLPRVRSAAAGSAEATGISTAGQEGRMVLKKNSEQGSAFAGRGQDGAEQFPPTAHESPSAEVKAVDVPLRISGAMDWQSGRPVGSFDRPSLAPSAPLTPEQAVAVDRISSLLLRETSLVRQYSSDSMAVVLRPDDSTELYVHFAQRNGHLDATIRCDRGDAQQLGALWPQLQQSLARQRVRLGPLQEGPSASSNFNHSSGFGSSGEGSGSQRHSPSDRQFMDDRPAPASSIPGVSHVRGRGGSRRRLTTSRPGWETWA